MINKIILGTAQFGLDYGINNLEGKPNKENVFKILDFARESGIQILDTADAYGNSKEILGEYLKKNNFSFKINSKFNNTNLKLEEKTYNSLEILNISYFNTYFFHDYLDFENDNNLLKSLINLKSDGVIKKIGLSVYNNNEFNKAILNKQVDVIQLPFNLLDNYRQRGGLLKKAKLYRKEIHVRSIFLQGLFFKNLPILDRKITVLNPYLYELQNLAINYNISMLNMAMNYVLYQEEVDYVIIGIDKISHLSELLSQMEGMIPIDLINKINDINVSEVEMLYPKNW